MSVSAPNSVKDTFSFEIGQDILASWEFLCKTVALTVNSVDPDQTAVLGSSLI